MGLHLAVKPPPFQNLVQQRKAEREIAVRTPCSSGIFTTSAFGNCGSHSDFVPGRGLRAAQFPMGFCGYLPGQLEAGLTYLQRLSFLGHFWVTYHIMAQSEVKRNVMISAIKLGERICFGTEKYDTFRKNSLS